MENKTRPQTQETITWEADEFTHHPKTALWYIGFTVIAAALLVYSFYSDSVLTIALFGLIVILAFVFSHKRPRRVSHQLTPIGIVLGDVIYPYKNTKKFWILYDPPAIKTLNLETTAYLNTEVTIQLGDQDPVPVKMYLKKYLPEDLDREETFSEVISRRLKF